MNFEDMSPAEQFMLGDLENADAGRGLTEGLAPVRKALDGLAFAAYEAGAVGGTTLGDSADAAPILGCWSMTTEELAFLRTKLKSGDYDGVDIMHAWMAIDELRQLRSWRDKAFQAHPNIDRDIELLCDGA